MAGENAQKIVPPEYDVNAKWDACLDLTVRRFVYSSLAGAFGGLLSSESCNSLGFSCIWRGVGIGSAYTDCSRSFDGSSARLAPPKAVDAPAHQAVDTPAHQTVDAPSPQDGQE